jgi:hypothetical protein
MGKLAGDAVETSLVAWANVSSATWSWRPFPVENSVGTDDSGTLRELPAAANTVGTWEWLTVSNQISK